MYTLKPDGLTASRQGYLFTYVQIVFNQLRRHIALQLPQPEYTGWMKFTQEFQIEAERLEVRILAVVSTALFLEAYIYDYGARKESGSFVDKYVDKLDPIAKWIVIPRLVAPPGFPPDEEVFERLRRVFKVRNDLIHHKTKAGEDFTSPPDFPPDLEPTDCVKLIVDLLTRLREIDASDHFADFVLRHLGSWASYVAKDIRFYPILWEA